MSSSSHENDRHDNVAAQDRGDIPEPYDESEVDERGTPFMLASRPPKTEPGSSAADVDGAESPSGPRGHHESVGERQGRQPGSDRLRELAEAAEAVLVAHRPIKVGTLGPNPGYTDPFYGPQIERLDALVKEVLGDA